MPGFGQLKKEAVSAGRCHDCGTCAGLCPDQCLKMDYYLEEPVPVKKCPSKACSLCYDVCPGKDIPMLDLERSIFGRERGATPAWLRTPIPALRHLAPGPYSISGA
jgi:coenzyme F420 hydrogenase subunit beta